jgi:hypothetical protein
VLSVGISVVLLLTSVCVVQILRELRKQHHKLLLGYFKDTDDFFRINKTKFELARAKMQLVGSGPVTSMTCNKSQGLICATLVPLSQSDPYAGLERPRRPLFKLLPTPEIMDEIIKQANKQWVLSVLEAKNPTNQPLPVVDIISLLQGLKPSIESEQLSIMPGAALRAPPGGTGLISPPTIFSPSGKKSKSSSSSPDISGPSSPELSRHLKAAS